MFSDLYDDQSSGHNLIYIAWLREMIGQCANIGVLAAEPTEPQPGNTGP